MQISHFNEQAKYEIEKKIRNIASEIVESKLKEISLKKEDAASKIDESKPVVNPHVPKEIDKYDRSKLAPSNSTPGNPPFNPVNPPLNPVNPPALGGDYYKIGGGGSHQPVNGKRGRSINGRFNLKGDGNRSVSINDIKRGNRGREI